VYRIIVGISWPSAASIIRRAHNCARMSLAG